MVCSLLNIRNGRSIQSISLWMCEKLGTTLRIYSGPRPLHTAHSCGQDLELDTVRHLDLNHRSFWSRSHTDGILDFSVIFHCCTHYHSIGSKILWILQLIFYRSHIPWLDRTYVHLHRPIAPSSALPLSRGPRGLRTKRALDRTEARLQCIMQSGGTVLVEVKSLITLTQHQSTLSSLV